MVSHYRPACLISVHLVFFYSLLQSLGIWGAHLRYLTPSPTSERIQWLTLVWPVGCVEVATLGSLCLVISLACLVVPVVVLTLPHGLRDSCFKSVLAQVATSGVHVFFIKLDVFAY